MLSQLFSICGIYAVKVRYKLGNYLVVLRYVCSIFAVLRDRVWNMKRIVIANTKGGTGKTTSSIFLASALTDQGSAEVWDADPQRSASESATRAEERDQALGFEVRPVNAAQLRRGSSSADFVVVDTGPGD